MTWLTIKDFKLLMLVLTVMVGEEPVNLMSSGAISTPLCFPTACSSKEKFSQIN